MRELTEAEKATNEKTLEHVEVVRQNLRAIISGLRQRGLDHDASKFKSPEVEIFTIFTPKLAATTYGSDEYKEYLSEMGVAIMYHYRMNSHHPEYHCFDEGGVYHPEQLPTGEAVSKMNLLDMIEMFCDWAAAVKRHNDGDLRESIRINTERFGLSSQIAQILINSVELFEGTS